MASSQHAASDMTVNGELFEKLENYPWSQDEEFQSGLQAILSSNPQEADVEPLTLQARCFYYSRKFNTQVDSLAYTAWRNDRRDLSELDGKTLAECMGNDEPEQKAASPEKPPYPLSFNRLVELITEGKEVPGIQEIPDTLLEGQSSQPTTSQRKKPWEKT